MICAQLAGLSGIVLDSFCQELVLAILPELPSLACDPHGIQVLKQLLALTSLNVELRMKLIHRLQGSLFKLTKDKHGCWLVQQALQSAPSELQSAFALELKGKVLQCSQHLHGNFVLQKCVELLPTDAVSFIIMELQDHVVEAALHVYSCRVLQRLIEHCQHWRLEMSNLLNSLLQEDSLKRLIIDPYGNNVVRAILSCGSAVHVQQIVEALASEDTDLLAYARNRHASLVLEKCLEAMNEHCDDAEVLQSARAKLMGALLGDGDETVTPPFAQIALDRFGNYIAQRVIDICQADEQQRVLRLLGSLGPKLRRAANGRHILQAARKKFGSTLSVTGAASE
ncbi:unnamed protein product [Effrenium voratum]|uniref:PUM-HD domain-containing protein n=1 Tax=Effrenium voratum TaxID=2562239 RepID=A0AA36JC84_9DINO|nr:unnamed protein product [Effrenium voratum]CAJ1430553.1 unnamed protein product [Effrenium voratum]